MRIDELRIAPQRDRHRIDGEIAAGEVGGQGCGVHLRERAGARVGLAARRRQIDLEAVDANRRGAEALVGARLPTQSPGELRNVALHRDVDVHPPATQQEIAHRSADQEGRHRGGSLAQAIDARERRQALPQSLGLDLGFRRRHGAWLRGRGTRSLP